MTKAVYKGKHLIGLTFSAGNVHDDGAIAWWQKQLRVHILVHKQEAERDTLGMTQVF